MGNDLDSYLAWFSKMKKAAIDTLLPPRYCLSSLYEQAGIKMIKPLLHFPFFLLAAFVNDTKELSAADAFFEPLWKASETSGLGKVASFVEHGRASPGDLHRRVLSEVGSVGRNNRAENSIRKLVTSGVDMRALTTKVLCSRSLCELVMQGNLGKSSSFDKAQEVFDRTLRDIARQKGCEIMLVVSTDDPKSSIFALSYFEKRGVIL